MKNKTSTSQNKLLCLTAMFFAGLILANCAVRTSTIGPGLTYYVAKIRPTVQEANLETARIALEDSIFESVNRLVAQDPTLTYSKALDQVLPMSKVASELPSGVVVVINNYGEATAHHVQVNIALDAPLKKYKVFSPQTFSVTDDDLSKGTLKISVGELATREKIRIAILLSEDYAVRLTASRTEDLHPPILLTSQTPSMNDVEIMATQTAVALYNQNNLENLLQFQIKYDTDDIQSTISILSDEMPGYFYETSTNEVEDKNLFFEAFPQ